MNQSLPAQAARNRCYGNVNGERKYHFRPKKIFSAYIRSPRFDHTQKINTSFLFFLFVFLNSDDSDDKLSKPKNDSAGKCRRHTALILRHFNAVAELTPLFGACQMISAATKTTTLGGRGARRRMKKEEVITKRKRGRRGRRAKWRSLAEGH